MVDKLTTVSRDKLGRHVGRLDDETMLRLNRAMIVFLGVAGETGPAHGLSVFRLRVCPLDVEGQRSGDAHSDGMLACGIAARQWTAATA